MISRETIERVKREARLVEIAGESVELKRKGSLYSACCPFHAERSPSFFVKDQTNTYTCYGCGESGNVISFVMAIRAISFPDAVESLAGRYGIPLVYDKKREPKEHDGQDRNAILKALEHAQRFFQASLALVTSGEEEGRLLRDYIAKRRIARESFKAFSIGYAPNGGQALVTSLIKSGISEEILLQAGLARRSASGVLRDLFRGRLIFPVYVDQKTVVGFGGRIIPGLVSEELAKELPKYLNSPESIVYQKSRTVFGLPQAIQEIRARKEVYLVEGYMDVVGLSQVGVKNVVASCGTAITEGHFKRLASIAGQIHLLLDGDSAGRSAAGRAFDSSLNCEADLDVVFLPDQSDPDDLAQKFGAETRSVIERLERAAPIEVYIDGVLRSHGVAAGARPGPNVLARVVESAVVLLARVRSRVAQDELKHRIARRLGVEVSIIDSMVDSKGGSARPPSPVLEQDSDQEQGIPEIKDLTMLEREVLRAVALTRAKGAFEIVREPSAVELLRPEVLGFLEGLCSALALQEDQQREAIKTLLRGMGGSWVQFWRECYVMLESPDVSPEEALIAVKKGLRRERIRALIELTKHEMMSLPSGSLEQAVVAKQKVELEKQLKQF